MIKLLAIDMDGTCLDSRNRISDETKNAMKAAAQSGLMIVPTTGRTTTCLPHQLADETFYRYVISSNGADVMNCSTGESLYQALIPGSCAAALLAECRKAHLGASIHVNHQFIVEGLRLNVLGRLIYGRDARNAICRWNLAGKIAEAPADLEEIQLFYFTEGARRKAREILSRQPALVSACSRFYMEIYAAQASKGHALSALASCLGLKKEEIACIGDEENDLSMFDASGLKFAMGNAIDALKARADIILPSNDASGVACAIQKYLL